MSHQLISRRGGETYQSCEHAVVSTVLSVSAGELPALGLILGFDMAESWSSQLSFLIART
jgi:hypothetical protein